MPSRSVIKTAKSQKGLALLVLVVVMMLAFLSYALTGLSIDQVKAEQQKKTRVALKKAKQALLAYAMNYPDTDAGQGNPTQGPGNIPCPDDDRDGDSDNPGSVLPGCNSGLLGTMGRFPWAELEMEELRDGNGDLLWYAASSSFVNSADDNINTSTVGGITIRDASAAIINDATSIDGVVAVIISAGNELRRDDGKVQSRVTNAEKDDPQNYLDTALGEDNADYSNFTTNGFISGPIRNAAGGIIVNDQFIVITYEEIMELVHARAGNDIASAFIGYLGGCANYPAASIFDPTKAKAVDTYISDVGAYEGHIPVDSVDWEVGGCADGLLPDWVEDEEWHKETYYHYAQSAPGCAVADCMSEFSTGANNIDALIVFAGRQTAAQVRGDPSSDITDYFEVENNNNDRVYNDDEAEDYVRVIAP